MISTQCPCCKHEIHADKYFPERCPYCRSPVYASAENTDDRQAADELPTYNEFTESQLNPTQSTHNVFDNARILICFILFIISTVFSISLPYIQNWLVDLHNDYGNHVYTARITEITSAIQHIVIALGATLAFFLDKRDKKAKAALCTLFVLAGSSAAIIWNHCATSSFFFLFDISNPELYLAGSLIENALCPILLLTFVLLNQKLKKFSLLWILPVLLLWLGFGSISVFAAAAYCTGFAKHLFSFSFIQKLFKN